MPRTTIQPGAALIGALEALYRLEPDDELWARGVLRQLKGVLNLPAGLGLASLGHDGDFTPTPPFLTATLADRWFDELFTTFISSCAAPDGADLFRLVFYPGEPVITHCQIEARAARREQEMIEALRAMFPYRDGLALLAYPAPGFAVLLWGLVDRGEVLPNRAELRVLYRLVGHFDAAIRLRMRPEQAIAAVLSPEGVHLDITEEALKRVSPRGRLSACITAVERTRLADRRCTADAHEDWQALVDGRYSVVPHEDTDGKRYYLLVRNAPYVEPHARLSAREVELARLAARGFTNKASAYALGLSPAATSAALATAAWKIGLGSRHELVEVARSLFGLTASDKADTARLTPAEREVFELLRRGLSNAEIALLRQRSVHTIGNQVSAILAKTNSATRRAVGAPARQRSTV